MTSFKAHNLNGVRDIIRSLCQVYLTAHCNNIRIP